MMLNDEEVEINARLCCLRLWPDFQGYGFNLHGEKGKSGHFIGEVEENSPAESAGLRQNDRLIEVNGVNVCNESHKDVVKLIKDGEGRVNMLVVVEAVERAAIARGIVISRDTAILECIEAADSQADALRKPHVEVVVSVEAPREERERSEEEQREYEEAVADSIAAAAMESLESAEPEPEPVREPSPEPVREPSPEPVREPSPEPQPTPVVEVSSSQANGVTVETRTEIRAETSAEANGSEKLSAAEYRALLQSRKKKDPRKSGTSFKDKTAMFEKM